MNSFGVLQALVFEPKKAFAALAERPRVLFPLVLLIASTIGMLLWYFSVADLTWLMDQSLRSNPRTAQMTEAQLQQAARFMTPTVIKWSALIGGVFGLVLIRLAEALYYLLAGKITKVQRSFKQWFALSCWSSLPAVLAVIPSAIVLLTTTTNQIDQGAMQSLSLNALFFHRNVGDSGYSLLISINLLQFASLYLAAFGVRLWSGRSWLFSVVFTALPWVLICGVWAFFALGRS